MYGITENGDVEEKNAIDNDQPIKVNGKDSGVENVGYENGGVEDKVAGTEIPVYYNNVLAS